MAKPPPTPTEDELRLESQLKELLERVRTTNPDNPAELIKLTAYSVTPSSPSFHASSTPKPP